MAAKPNFIYTGPDKAGSSWLHEVLITHPQVFMPEAKDLYFFDRYYDKGLGWYLKHFQAARPEHLVVGEVCQDYLADPRCPARIEESLGQVRTMVTLRDPADRAYSSYLYMLKHGETPGTFLQALSRRPELIEHGRYGAGLARFSERFGRDQIYVALFDELVADPQAFVDGLLRWLGITPLVLDEEMLQARLSAGKARSLTMARLARLGANVVRAADGANLVGRVKRSTVVQRLLYRPLGEDRPQITDEERTAVHEALAEDLELLQDLVGMDLATRWGWPQPRDRSPRSS